MAKGTWVAKSIKRSKGTNEGTYPTVKSLLSWDYVHHVGPNERWVLWKEFGLIAYYCGDTAVLR